MNISKKNYIDWIQIADKLVYFIIDYSTGRFSSCVDLGVILEHFHSRISPVEDKCFEIIASQFFFVDHLR